ncbi:hypothetical protein [Micromonospora sp. CPCC 206061]
MHLGQVAQRVRLHAAVHLPAYGGFAAVQGAGALAGGVAVGALYQQL